MNDLLGREYSTYFNNMSAVFTPKTCYLAVYDDAGYPYTLACIDRAAVRVVWKSEGWGSWWYAVGGQVGKARVSVELQDNRVLVFGVSGLNLIHAEAFRADNGKNLFRFSNTYCM
jgi:ABC-type glucose/galactose transport system permease subunit